MGRKISSLTSDEFLDVLCIITPYVENIAKDADVMETLGKAVKKEGLTRAGVMLLGIEKLAALVPVLLKKHRADVYGIVAGVNELEPEQVAAQSVLKTAAQIRDIVCDKELLLFFKSSAESEETG